MFTSYKFKKMLGAIAAITGAAMLIIYTPSWIWMLFTGGFLMWFGCMLYKGGI